MEVGNLVEKCVRWKKELDGKEGKMRKEDGGEKLGEDEEIKGDRQRASGAVQRESSLRGSSRII